MALKPYSDEDALKILLKVEVHLHGDRDVVSACHTAPTPTPLCKKRKSIPSPPLWEAGLVFGRGPTPTVSFPHTPSTKPSIGPDCVSPGLARQGPWPYRLECHPRVP